MKRKVNKYRGFLLVLFYLLAVLFVVSCSKDRTKRNLKAMWIENAFQSLTFGDFPRVKAVSWWNENFGSSLLRIDSSPEALDAYRKGVSQYNFITQAVFVNQKLIPPQNSLTFYHGAFPDFGSTEDQVSKDKIEAFENLAQKKIVWAYFSNNWGDSIEFPEQQVEAILAAGKVPFIRIMPRSQFTEGVADPKYTLQKIINGDFDNQLRFWAQKAKNIESPLLIDFAPEMNGNWFPWSGYLNGGGIKNGYGDPAIPDGPERYRDAYRHIVTLFRQWGVNNITWFFHVNAEEYPKKVWNKIANYYPGDDYVDWVGVSVYGPQKSDEEYRDFKEILTDSYNDLCKMTKKPIAVLEFGVTEMDE